MDKKYQVFISSTYADLVEERKVVQDTILSMYHFPVGMELFSAADENQWDVIKETIDSSDYYVLIVAHRYGSVIQSGPEAGLSYTEKEYRYAKSQGIPILAFLIDSSVCVKPENIERDHPEQLHAFIEDIKTGRIVEWWKTKDELSRLVMNSLYKQFARKKRSGWIRDTFNAETTLSEIVKLNQKIRDLSTENQKLKEELEVFQISSRLPKLTATIYVDTIEDKLGNNCFPKYAIQDENDVLKGVKVFDIDIFESVKKNYKQIEKTDFPDDLFPFAQQNEIDAYNDSLPTEEEIQRYALELKEYAQNKKSCVHINIVIQNKGNAKACNASAEIEFPEGVTIYDDKLLDIEQPVAPKVSDNPIQLARKRKEDEYGAKLNFPQVLPNLFLTGYDSLKGMNFSNLIAEGNKDYSLYDNTVDIDCGTIIHTKKYWRRGLYLVGRKPGKYQIKCTFMCEEYEGPQVEYIDFEVQ